MKYISVFIISTLAIPCVAYSESFSDNYKKAYQALKNNDCETAMPLLSDELKTNSSLTDNTKISIKNQIQKCKTSLSVAIPPILEEITSRGHGIIIQD